MHITTKCPKNISDSLVEKFLEKLDQTLGERIEDNSEEMIKDVQNNTRNF